jgi:hypothetical protein
MPIIVRVTGRSIPRLLIIVGFAAMLGACSKCDVPTWQPSRTPASCHGDAPLQ